MYQKTIVITGSTRGIGLGMAKEFLTFGHQVVINGRSANNINDVLAELKKISPEVSGVAGSVSNEETHINLVNKAKSEFGKIDIWINNAGVPQPHKSFVDIETCHIQQLSEVNITGSLIGTKVAANFMSEQGYGKIFNMEGFGSDGRMMDKITLYGTTKGAINYFSKSVSKELSKSSIQIGIIQPGMVRTDFIKTSMSSASEEEMKRFKKVYDVLAEDVDIVTGALVPKILASNKNYDRIEFLSKIQLMVKIFKMLVKR